ncbi:MAG: YlxM family DNA-binding protein [Lachnospiraceae bacterium]
MERIIEQGILYDFYGPLLTKHQQEIYESVVYNNLSLGEIAAEEGISRQGVHDLVRRCDKILADYEDKLHLVKRFGDNKKKLSEIKELTGMLAGETAQMPEKKEEVKNKINLIIDELLEEL